NLVGHVGTVAVPFSQVKVQVAGQAAITFDQAVTQGLIRSTVFKFSGTSYSTTTQFEPFRGVWIRANQALTLIIPPAPAATGASVRRPSVSPANGGSRRPNLGLVPRTPQPRIGTDGPPAPPRF